jgi:hypothetical protein
MLQKRSTSEVATSCYNSLALPLFAICEHLHSAASELNPDFAVGFVARLRKA